MCVCVSECVCDVSKCLCLCLMNWWCLWSVSLIRAMSLSLSCLWLLLSGACGALEQMEAITDRYSDTEEWRGSIEAPVWLCLTVMWCHICIESHRGGIGELPFVLNLWGLCFPTLFSTLFSNSVFQLCFLTLFFNSVFKLCFPTRFSNSVFQLCFLDSVFFYPLAQLGSSFQTWTVLQRMWFIPLEVIPW